MLSKVSVSLEQLLSKQSTPMRCFMKLTSEIKKYILKVRVFTKPSFITYYKGLNVLCYITSKAVKFLTKTMIKYYVISKIFMSRIEEG